MTRTINNDIIVLRKEKKEGLIKMNDKTKINILLIIILILIILLIYILNTNYQIEVNGIVYKQKLIYYFLGVD